MRKSTLVLATAATTLLAPKLLAASLYWDLNGTDPGAGATPTGVWDTTSSNWNASADGTGLLSTWSATETAVFSAGSDAIGAYTINVNAAQTAAAIAIEEGIITLGGTQGINVATGTVTLGPGTALITNSSLRIGIDTGGGYILNGGTLQTTNTGINGSFVDSQATIVLGAGGGTIQYEVPNNLNIIQSASVISGSGSLTKTGVGVIAIASTSTYTGATNITNGELRIRTSANRLPTGTPVTVTGAGILNLNSVSQQIGSLSGDGSVGLGNGTLTVGNGSNTAFSGVIADIKNGGAGGVTTGNGKVTKVGGGTLTLSGINTYTGTFTLSAGVVTVTSSGSLADAVCDVVVNGGTLNLNNAAQTIENLSGSGGTINLGSGHTLTVNPVANSTYNGVIAGAGALTKTSTFAEALAGANTFTGATTIGAGTLEVVGSLTGTAKVDVSGTLAGDGSIAPALAGNINLLVTGKLSPGSTVTPASSVGSLDVTLSGGGALDLTLGVTSSNSQSLVFELASPLSSDKLSLTGGTINIGAGLLEFDDFSFTTAAGFVENVDYVLFDGNLPIIGTLGANLTGTVGGSPAQIQFADGGSDIILHVVPEPSAMLALLGGATTLLGLRRRRS